MKKLLSKAKTLLSGKSALFFLDWSSRLIGYWRAIEWVLEKIFN
jgi:hypothetical protein